VVEARKDNNPSTLAAFNQLVSSLDGFYAQWVADQTAPPPPPPPSTITIQPDNFPPFIQIHPPPPPRPSIVVPPPPPPMTKKQKKKAEKAAKAAAAAAVPAEVQKDPKEALKALEEKGSELLKPVEGKSTKKKVGFRKKLKKWMARLSGWTLIKRLFGKGKKEKDNKKAGEVEEKKSR